MYHKNLHDQCLVKTVVLLYEDDKISLTLEPIANLKLYCHVNYKNNDPRRMACWMQQTRILSGQYQLQLIYYDDGVWKNLHKSLLGKFSQTCENTS